MCVNYWSRATSPALHWDHLIEAAASGALLCLRWTLAIVFASRNIACNGIYDENEQERQLEATAHKTVEPSGQIGAKSQRPAEAVQFEALRNRLPSVNGDQWPPPPSASGWAILIT